MAGVCCSPGFLRQIEKPKDTEAIDCLKKTVQLLGRTEIEQLVSQIESVWQPHHESAFGVEGASSNLEISNSEFGRLLVKNLSTNCGENNVSKACFLNRLKRETQNVLSDVLKEEGNMRWVAGGLSVVSYTMEELKNRNNFGNEYRHSLLYMLGLLKHMNNQTAWDLPKDKRDSIVQFIVVGCLVFAIPLETKIHFGCGSQLNVADIKNLEFRLGSTHEDLAFGIIKKSIQPHTRHINEVGIKEARELVIELLDVQSDDKSRRAIVIEGPDGIGKTTFANATFSRLQLRRYKVARLDIDHDVSEPDMKILQQRILRDLFRKDIILKSCVEGRARLSNAFREEACRPIFIFIDTAHCKFDLGKLLPEDEQLLPIQSRILITTTDRTKCSIPAYIDMNHYQMKPLANAEAKILIGKNVLGGAETIGRLIKTCRGIPLALTMLASYLRKNGDQNSAHAFDSINPSSSKASDICSSIVDFLYKRLEEIHNETYTEAFLDIAIFFNNWERHLVTLIFPEIELTVLEEMGLIMISREDRLSINAAVTKRAKKISGTDRITNVESFNALRVKQNLSQVKGIWLSEGELEAAALDEMHKSLRVLYLGKSAKVKGEYINKFHNLRFFYLYNKDHLPQSLINFTRLTYFHGSIENDHYFDKLKEFFDISDLRKGPRELQLGKSLHVLNLSDSEYIVELPKEFSCLFSLEVLDLSNCVKLTRLPESLDGLESLYRLNLRGCLELQALPETLGKLFCLGELDCTFCLELKVVPDSFGQLKSLCHLQLRGCSQLNCLPESFGNLYSLEYLDLSYCTQLSKLPSSFQKLGSLSHLRLACSGLTELPKDFGNLYSLKELDLSSNQNLESLEESFGKLHVLCYLYLKGCSKLTSLSDNFSELSDLEELDLTGCDKLARLPDHFGHFKCLHVLKLSCSELRTLPPDTGFMLSLKRMSLTDCKKLARLPAGICALRSLSHLHLGGCSKLTELPRGFEKLSSLEKLEITGCKELKSLPDDQPPSLRVLKLRGCSQFNGLPENIGNLSKLEELALTGCGSLQRLPASLCEIKSLRHLRLRGDSKLTSLPANLPSSIETLDLGDCSNLRMHQDVIRSCTSLKLLFFDGCSELCRLPDDFRQLNSLRYLSIAGCTELTTLSDRLENMTNLVAVDASGCPKLQGETMDCLAKLQCLYFVDVSKSDLLTKRWKEERELHHQLVVRLQMDNEAMYTENIVSPQSQQIKELRQPVVELQRYEEAMYADTIISCLSSISAIETERFALVITCSSDNKALELVEKKIKELYEQDLRTCSIYINHNSKMCSEMKSRNLLSFAILRLLKTRHPELFSALEILHTWIVTVDVCTDQEGQQHIEKLKVELPAVGDGDGNDIVLQALTDSQGGVPMCFPSLFGVVADNFFPPLLGVVADKFAKHSKDFQH